MNVADWSFCWFCVPLWYFVFLWCHSVFLLISGSYFCVGFFFVVVWFYIILRLCAHGVLKVSSHWLTAVSIRGAGKWWGGARTMTLQSHVSSCCAEQPEDDSADRAAAGLTQGAVLLFSPRAWIITMYFVITAMKGECKRCVCVCHFTLGLEFSFSASTWLLVHGEAPLCFLFCMVSLVCVRSSSPSCQRYSTCVVVSDNCWSAETRHPHWSWKCYFGKCESS